MVLKLFVDLRPEVDEACGPLPEMHLYFGSRCNRSCDFCTVSGSPKGWLDQIGEEHLDSVVQHLHPRAQLKIYGGEPTLLDGNLLWAFHCLRERGFAGRLVIFSNGIQADRLIRLLGDDEDSCAVLNYSILTGTNAEPIPPSALLQLTAHERQHPGSIFAGHADLVEIGRAVEWSEEAMDERGDFDRTCPRCYPTVTTRGQYHACPFAVENPAPQYRLGDLQSPLEGVRRKFQAFLGWIDEVVEPAARRQGRHPCTVCTAAAGALAMPEYADAPGGAYG